jgi:multidrug efflux system membrane fusion protein
LTKWQVVAGRVVAVVVLGGAVVLGLRTAHRLDARPRTQDAYLYADSIGVVPEISGKIVSRPVKEGQRVTKGAILAQIEREPFELRLAQARAQRAALEKQIDLTGRQNAAQTSGAAAAATQIQRARAQLALAHDTVERLAPLVGKGYATVQQLDEARSNESVAQASLTAAAQQAEQAHLAVGDTESQKAQILGTEAAIGLAERDLRNTTLTAPFDGYLVGIDFAEGAFATAGRALFTLVKADEWYAVGDFRETELTAIHPGDSATVWLLADANRPLEGHVESLGWGVRPEGGGGPGLPAVGRTLNWVVIAQRFPVRIRLDDLPPDTARSTRIGASVTIRVGR